MGVDIETLNKIDDLETDFGVEHNEDGTHAAVTRSISNADTGTVYAQYKKFILNPATNVGSRYGDYLHVEVERQNASNFSLIGGRSTFVYHYGTGTVSNLYALSGYAFHYGTNTVTTFYGIRGVAATASSGNVTNAMGIYGQFTATASGTVTDGYSVYSRTTVSTPAIATNTYGVASEFYSNTGTITNAYGLYSTFTTNTGTITNAYGLYINQVLGTNKWAIYVLDASDNYLAGKLGIGTPTPTSPLQVVGLAVYANNAAALAGGLTAGAFYRTGADPDPVCVVH